MSSVERDERRGTGSTATRTRLLAPTRDALTEDGGAVSLAAIARRAGVSRQAVYLHFGDRRGLLLAVVAWMDASLDLEASLAHVFAAPDPEDLLARLARLNGTFWAAVAPVARVLQSEQHADPALAAAWADRMTARRRVFGDVVERLVRDGALAASWDREQAVGMIVAATHFESWRELTDRLGWDADAYADALTLLLQRALLT